MQPELLQWQKWDLQVLRWARVSRDRATRGGVLRGKCGGPWPPTRATLQAWAGGVGGPCLSTGCFSRTSLQPPPPFQVQVTEYSRAFFPNLAFISHWHLYLELCFIFLFLIWKFIVVCISLFKSFPEIWIFPPLPLCHIEGEKKMISCLCTV